MGGESLPWFARHGGLALFAAGFAMVVAALGVEDEVAVKTVLILIGAALVLIGVLLPRLSGTLEISTTGVKIPVVALQRLEATKREAERRAPDRVYEAVGRAYELLGPLLASGDDIRFAIASTSSARSAGAQERQPDTPRGEIPVTCPKCGHENEEWEAFCGSCGQFLEWAGERVNPGKAPTGAHHPAPAAPPPLDGAPQPPLARRARPPAPRPTADQPDAEVTALLEESPTAFAERVLNDLAADQD